MLCFVVSPRAREDIKGIATYTFDMWERRKCPDTLTVCMQGLRNLPDFPAWDVGGMRSPAATGALCRDRTSCFTEPPLGKSSYFGSCTAIWIPIATYAEVERAPC